MDNFPTNFGTERRNRPVPSPDLTTTLSSVRDWPLMRSFHSKNDDHWDIDVINQYHSADSVGPVYWSERAHGPDGPDYNDHWINGFTAAKQTIVDDIAYEEAHFRSDVSFPAFFHRLDPQNNDPGDAHPAYLTAVVMTGVPGGIPSLAWRPTSQTCPAAGRPWPGSIQCRF